MDCIFLNAAGTTLFVRDDMESGHWVQEQMNVTANFPFDAGKVSNRVPDRSCPTSLSPRVKAMQRNTPNPGQA